MTSRLSLARRILRLDLGAGVQPNIGVQNTATDVSTHLLELPYLATAQPRRVHRVGTGEIREGSQKCSAAATAPQPCA